MATALALAGWPVALSAGAVAYAARRTLANRNGSVARAAHELRGGIGAARLGLSLAGRTGELGSPRLRAIELELDRAALALEDLDCGRPGWALEFVDVRRLLVDSVEAWQAPAALWGVDLRLRWAGARAVVLGDRVRLAQATGNLIANSLEHGAGSVEVCGRVDGAAVRLEVSDEGPGLPAPVAELVGRRRRKHSSRGHGLRIAAEVARNHGGRLSAAPSVQGARLVLELPAAQSADRGSRVG